MGAAVSVCSSELHSLGTMLERRFVCPVCAFVAGTLPLLLVFLFSRPWCRLKSSTSPPSKRVGTLPLWASTSWCTDHLLGKRLGCGEKRGGGERESSWLSKEILIFCWNLLKAGVPDLWAWHRWNFGTGWWVQPQNGCHSGQGRSHF